MTTLESIDNTNMENVTVTSDEAFERVTSNESFEEEWWDGYLKQNTAWLVQEIPNISFLDIADTMLESKKTFHNRQNWILRIWKAGKSVEAQPQDAARMTHISEWRPSSDSEIIPFTDITTASNLSLFTIENNKITIWYSWIYRVSYWWVCWWWTRDLVTIWVIQERNWVALDHQLYDAFDDISVSSGWKTWWLSMEEWDEIYLKFECDSYSSIKLQWLYLDIQYTQNTL